MSFLLIIQGFLVKVLTGGDDTLVHIPLLGTLFKSKWCKISFLFGMLLSLGIIIAFSSLIGGYLQNYSFSHYLLAALLIVLAVFVYFNSKLFKPRKKLEDQVKKKVCLDSSLQAITAGFLAFFITAIDDAIIYSSVLLKPLKQNLFVILGILIAFALEVIVIFYFSKQISKLKYTKEITTVVLIGLAALVFFQVI